MANARAVTNEMGIVTNGMEVLATAGSLGDFMGEYRKTKRQKPLWSEKRKLGSIKMAGKSSPLDRAVDVLANEHRISLHRTVTVNKYETFWEIVTYKHSIMVRGDLYKIQYIH